MKKVAIIVPTLDRLGFVLRMIKYYASINCPHPIFIGDASSESSKELVLKTAQNNVEVYYFHWESLKARKTMIKLAQEASKFDGLDFCAYHGDDDFFIPEPLSQCADFLHDNHEYATAQGRAFRFELIQQGPHGELKDIGIYWNKNELNGVTALERLNEITTKYFALLLSVHRINEFIDDTSIGVEVIIDRNFGEIANSFSMAMRGKSKFVDCLYLARNIHSAINHPKKDEWIKGENWQSSYVKSISVLSEVLSSYDNLSLAKSNNLVKFALENVISPKVSVFNRIKGKYSEYIYKKGFIYILSKLYRRIKYSPILPSDDFSNRGLRSTKSKYFKDVSIIVNSCKKDGGY